MAVDNLSSFRLGPGHSEISKSILNQSRDYLQQFKIVLIKSEGFSASVKRGKPELLI